VHSDADSQPDITATAEHRFRAVSVGWSLRLIAGLLDHVEARTPYSFSHICVADLDLDTRQDRAGQGPIHRLREHPASRFPAADRDLLGSLERADVPTIHNMIMGDRIVRHLQYQESLAYATYLARRLTALFQQLKPAVIIGGFDSLHSGIGLAVARKLDIPWFAMNFSTLPKGLACFCTGLTPDTGVVLRPPNAAALRALAEHTLCAFETRELAAPAHLSADSTVAVLKRLPTHARVLWRAVRRAATGHFDRFTDQPALRLCRQYARKRMNLLSLPTRWFSEVPPTTPYMLFGLHMQPESSIDVWAPFHADQVGVIESLARSLPPTHALLVKLHKSDADNYSRRQLARLRRLPGVRLVSPYAPSRTFIENASLVFAIQGTIALEAALLGKPVLMFGDSRLVALPSVSRVNRITELPGQIRQQLSRPRPSREAVIQGLMSYLGVYSAACHNDWELTPSAAEIRDVVDLFEALRAHVESPRSGAAAC
jgi:hypothetical protein